MAGVQMGFQDGLAKDPKPRSKTDRRAKNDSDTCLGCSACVLACENEAILMVPRDDYHVPPKNKGWMFTRILWEKDRLAPFVFSRIKRKLSIFSR